MPVHVVSQDGHQKDTVPTHLTVIPISLISIDTDVTDKAVKGNVSWKGPLVPLPDDNFVIKIIIEGKDDTPSVSINAILFGRLAKEFSDAANLEDVVVASGFAVGKSPTVHKDKLHPCNLLLKGDHACVYVSRTLASAPRSSAAVKRTTKHPIEVPRPAKYTKYTYTKLADLKAGTVVNVYAVVVFFKPPYPSRGTDYCSSVTIIDQSNRKVSCTIFCTKLADHPKILQIGDIIRMHRLKAQCYNGSINLISTSGFSVVTFDGAVGRPIEPRTSSQTFAFDQDDCRTVEELRSLAAAKGVLAPEQMAVLSDVQPNTYFDLTCQLLAKASIDSNCIMLLVWDGTRCPHKMLTEPSLTDGPASFPDRQKELIVNILVYDNHVQVAKQLKPSDFLRIYNIHARLASDKDPDGNCGEGCHLTFVLHGGTSYGKGIQVIPETSPDLTDMKGVMKNLVGDFKDDLSDSLLLDIWVTPPESPDEDYPVQLCTERTCAHSLTSVSLAEVKRSNRGGAHHVRVQLKSYEPQLLHQSLKLYCSKCQTMQEVPDNDLVARIFSEASQSSSGCGSPTWLIPMTVQVPSDSSESKGITAYVFRQLPSGFNHKDIMFLSGCTLQEAFKVAAGSPNVVPVRLSGDRIDLLDLTAPFLFRGRRQFYGCERCSKPELAKPTLDDVDTIDAKLFAEAFGIQMLEYVLLLKLELQDATDTLDVYLWRDAEKFFKVSASDAATNQEAQNSIHQTMDFLCPPGGSADQRPWLDLCLTAYQPSDSQNQTCYQVCDTTVLPPT